MSDKNRDICQLHAGVWVAFDKAFGGILADRSYALELSEGFLIVVDPDDQYEWYMGKMWWDTFGGYIVPQPEEATACQVRTREDQVADIVKHLRPMTGVPEGPYHAWAEQQILEAEQRGFERRVEEEQGDPAYWIDHHPTPMSPPYAVETREQCAFPDMAEPVFARPQCGYARRVAEEQGEPVAWVAVHPNSIERDVLRSEMRDHYEQQGWHLSPLYAASCAKLEAAESMAWQSVASAPWDTDVLLAWRGMDGKWKFEAGWAGHANSCPPESGASNGWQHGNAEFWCPIPSPPKEGPSDE